MRHNLLSRVRGVLVYAVLVTLLGIASLTLTQCTQVSDTVTGVGLSHGRRHSCIGECQRSLVHLTTLERRRHHVNLRLCNDDSKCEAAENARYRAALESLYQAYRECRAHCHRQGGGDD